MRKRYTGFGEFRISQKFHISKRICILFGTLIALLRNFEIFNSSLDSLLI